MAGRIRTIKPEWLDDERLCSTSVEARLLSVALLLLADDFGRGRAHPAWIAAQVFVFCPDRDAVATKAMAELEAAGYVRTYTVRGQVYFEVVNWGKHQKVEKPGAPRVPSPEDDSGIEHSPTSRRLVDDESSISRRRFSTDHDPDHDRIPRPTTASTTPAGAQPTMPYTDAERVVSSAIAPVADVVSRCGGPDALARLLLVAIPAERKGVDAAEVARIACVQVAGEMANGKHRDHRPLANLVRTVFVRLYQNPAEVRVARGESKYGGPHDDRSADDGGDWVAREAKRLLGPPKGFV